MTGSVTGSPPSPLGRFFLLEVLCALVVICGQAAGPVPAGNEAHYIVKAKHFWDSDWAKGDFFLQTGNAHLVFYLAFGWLTRFLSLAATTWVVRLLGWGFLAFAWTRMIRSVIPRFGFAILALAVFAATQRRWSMALEWVIYGGEAKVFAYGFVFLALSALIDSNWKRCWIFLGLATLWHPVVGGWTTLVSLCCSLVIARGLQPIRQSWPRLLLAGVIALGGLLPAILVNRGAPTEVTQRATSTLVYERLPHHLYPPGFLPGTILRHWILLGLWVVFGLFSLWHQKGRRFQLFVCGSLAVSLCGFVITFLTPNHSAFQASILRFYWFRLFDVMVAIGAGVGICHFTLWLLPRRPWLGVWMIMLLAGLGYHFYERIQAITNGIPVQFKLAEKKSEAKAALENWKRLGLWVRQHAPADATFITPSRCQTFIWYAHRGEVASWKNVPQDAVSVVEWRRRMEKLHGTLRYHELKKKLHEKSPRELRELGQELGAEYMVYYSKPWIDLPKVYPKETSGARNDHFVIYSLK